MYTIPYPATTALAGDEHKFSWLEAREQVIAIPPGQIGEVPLTFVSAGLVSGTFTGSVNMIPLNSNSNPLSVPVSLNVLAGFEVNNLITGIEGESGKSLLAASPNPFERKVKIQVNGDRLGEATVALVDLTGRIVWKSKIDFTAQHEVEINGNHLSSGLYTCLLFVNNKLIESIRLMKD